MYKIKLLVILAGLLLFSKSTVAQISGTVTVPGTYATIAAAVSDINIQPLVGPLTVLIAPGYIETAPVGGYTLTGTGTAANPIIFQKNGSGTNPLINAYSGGVGTPATAIQDGVFSFIGSDYITIDGVDIADPNTTNPSTMEYGYGFFKANATNGCQNNTVQNCVVTLRRINNAAGSGPSIEGSKCIELANALISTHTTAVILTSAAGSNSNNKFYHNTFQNCNIGIALSGLAAGSPFTLCDNNNDVGGNSILTGNTILNYGGGAITSPAAAVYSSAQYNINISYNTINNNNGAPGAANHTNTLRGVYLGPATSANAAVSNNTITVKGGGTSPTVAAVENASGSTPASNTISITNNVITNCSYSTATSGQFFGILNYATAANVVINANDISGLILNPAVTTGQTGFIYNGAIIGTALSITSNTIENATNISSSGNIYCMYSSNATQNYTVQNNYVNNVSRTSGSNGAFYGFVNSSTSAAGGTAVVSNNVFTNLSCGASSTFYGIYQWTSTSQVEIVSANLFNNISLGLGSSYIIYHSSGNAGSAISSNTISNILSQGSLVGIYHGNSSSVSLNINNNLIYALSNNSSGIAAMSQGGGTSTSIFKNKIYDITANGSGANAYGLTFNAGNNTYIYNNYIGDLKAPISSNPGTLDCIDGIEIQAGSTYYISYNTIVLDAANGGSAFYTSALYTYTNSNVTLRNNILINNSISNGGKAVAYRRNGNNLFPFNTNSNNNLLYAGGPGASYIYWDGTATPQVTLANYKTLVSPRDAAAVTENTQFLSMVGSSPGYLHIDPSVLTLAESGAANVAGITDDFDGDVRFGNPGYLGTGSAPDIGADEFDNVIPACSAVSSPTIGSVSQNKCYGQTATLTATGFTNGSGIVQQWQISSTPGGPYTTISGANNPAAYTTPTLGTGTYYYVLLTTCTISSLSAISNEATVTVHALPVVTANSSSTLVCSGNTVTLNGGGANTYTWTGGVTNGLAFTPASSSNYTVTGTDINNCTSTAQISVSINSVPATPGSISGSITVCSGNTPSYSIATVAGAVSYNWLLPSGWTGSSTTNIINTTAGVTSGNVTVTAVNGCGSSAIKTLSVTVNTIPALPASISGNATICSATANTYSITAIAGATSYNWTLPIGWSGSSATNSINTTSNATSGNITVNAVNSCGSSAAQTLSVTVNAIPSTPGTISGSITICSGTTNAYSISAVSGATSYSWTLPVGWTGSSSTNNIAATSNASSGNITVSASNVCGISASNTLSVTVNSIPGTPGIINGNSPICSGSSNTYSIAAIAGATSYNWTLPSGWAGSSATNNISSTANTNSGNITVSASNVCGTSAAQTLSVTVNNIPIAPSVINGSNTICAGSSNTYSTPSVAGATAYNWLLPSGWAGSSTTNNISSTASANSGNITVSASNVCGTSALTTLSVTVNFLPGIPGIINGNSTICSGSSNAYSITSVAGATSYNWSLPGGWTGTSTTNNISATSNAISGNVTVSASNACGTSAVNTLSVTVNTAPAVPLSISGNASICSGSSNTYSVATVSGATSYNWTLPSGWAGTSTTNNISTVANASSGNILVSASNACGTSALQTLSVTVTTVPATPGSITGNTTICSGSLNTYSIAAVAGATGYIWNLPSGWSGSSITNSITSNASTNSGTISIIASNSCGSSAPQTLSVAVNALPVISVNSGTICSGQSFTINPSGANTYTYSSGSAIVSPVSNSSYSVTGTSTAGCVSSSSAISNVTVNALPVISVNSGTICSGQSFTMNPSGANTYTYSSGSAIVSPLLNTSYSVTGTSTAGCVSSISAVSNVTVNTNPVITVASGAICIGGSFTLNPSGASTYTYSSGSPVVSPVITTTYSITGTSAQGCTSTIQAVATITVSSTLTISITGTTTVCSGQPANLTAGGASTYSWSTGATTNTITDIPAINTSYTVTGSSGSCSNTAVVIVTVNPLPIISVNNGSICQGQSFTITPGGANTYTYSGGSAIVNPTTNASYSVTGTDSQGCISSTPAVSNITVNALPAVSATANNSLICSGQTATLTATGAAIYTWNTSASGSLIAVTPTITTNYTVTGTDNNGCSNTATVTQNVSTCTGISFLIKNEIIDLYPNPTTGVLNIKMENQKNLVEIYNSIGQLVFEETIYSNDASFNIKHLLNGIYFVKVGTIIKKIIKE